MHGDGNRIPPAFACGKTHLPLQGRLGRLANAGGETLPCGDGNGIPPAFACGKTHLPLQGRLGWLSNVGGETLPCGSGNGNLQGPLVKGAGFRDCASKRGRLGDSCCGWRDFAVRRWDRNPSGFCLRQNPPPFTREAWVVSQRRWRGFAVWRWERQAPRPPCKGGWLPRLRKQTRKTGGFLLRVDAVHLCSKASLTAVSIASQTPRKS